MFAPANIPVTAGKNTPKMEAKSWFFSNAGIKFCLKTSTIIFYFGVKKKFLL
jgi:hypothetical protein